MMYCHCGGATKVLATRSQAASVIRNLVCLVCHERSMTIEQPCDASAIPPKERAPRRAGPKNRFAPAPVAITVAAQDAARAVSTDRRREARQRIEDLRDTNTTKTGWEL